MNSIEYFSFLVLLSNVGFVLLLLFGRKVTKLIAPYALDLAIVFSALATLGSLYLSEILFLPPCKLCWFQRIFMYPLVFILLTARVRKIPKIWEIVMPLVTIGAFIAIYHYYLQFAPGPSTTCGTVGISASCSDKPFVHFGYITIPWMALSAFAWIGALMLILKNSVKK
jgi:disulfide bond formation protein DsbB